jgi:hypothetical protein
MRLINYAPQYHDEWGIWNFIQPFLMEVNSQHHASATLPSEFCRKLGGPQSRSGHYAEEKILLPLPESNDEFSVAQPVT